ncbi:PIG-L deacetylase family protein, partial [Arthrobacter sp. Hiyo1]|uniref:PIG-L deacetylase family protein n=1 Tax=Arthrobacter sp. Hiyo1 TaxID=1588020 RepID=UPI000A8620A8
GAWIQVVALVRNTSAGFYAGASATGWHGRESFRGGSGVEGLWGDVFLSGQRVLVIAPHADDETYGCAGTIARIKSLGGEVFVLLGSLGGVDHYGSAGRGR